jgi:hypothetical protein
MPKKKQSAAHKAFFSGVRSGVPRVKPKRVARTKQIKSILQENKNLNFVDRVLHRKNYPTLPLGDGMTGSHLMSWGEANGKYYAYPNIIDQGGALRLLAPDQAFNYALQSGEAIEFDTPEKADAFTKDYKLVWPYREQ